MALEIIVSIAFLGPEVVLSGLSMLGGFSTGLSFFYITYLMMMFIPAWAIQVRRLHDIGKSGWMQLISLIPFVGGIWLLVLLCKESQPEENKYDLVVQRNKKSGVKLFMKALMMVIVSQALSALSINLLLSSNDSSQTLLFTIPEFIISAASNVFMILALIYLKKENNVNKLFFLSFIVFWLQNILSGFSNILVTQTNLGSSTIMVLFGILHTANFALLYLTLLKMMDKTGIGTSKNAKTLIIVSMCLYFFQAFAVPWLIDQFTDSVPALSDNLYTISSVFLIIAFLLLVIVRVEERGINNPGIEN
jgi:uncharacterized membrane protein YhaH (DUF805 family)